MGEQRTNSANSVTVRNDSDEGTARPFGLDHSAPLDAARVSFPTSRCHNSEPTGRARADPMNGSRMMARHIAGEFVAQQRFLADPRSAGYLPTC